MILVAVNLTIFCAILTIFYLLCRRAWGPVAGFVATGTFIAVFGFSQLVGISNYNYATPYAHETTHGVIVSLALVLILCRWIVEPSCRWSFTAGLCLGLDLVLKPEFIFAGVLVILTAFALRFYYFSLPTLRSLFVGAVGMMIPTLGFAAYFAAFVPTRQAFSMAAGAWLRFVSPSVGANAGGGIQSGFSGVDQAGNHLSQHLLATSLACLLIGGITGLGWLSKKVSRHSLFTIIAVVVATLFGWLSWSMIKWTEVGRTFFGLMLIYLTIHGALVLFAKSPRENLQQTAPRILLAMLGAALMARMALNGRIYHYGFYQAAIAGSILPAILICELPERLRTGLRERVLILVAILALLLPGVVTIVRASQGLIRLKTASVGEGLDRFYVFPRTVDYTGELVDAATKSLKKEGKVGSLLVLPEGIMINYLTRIPSTVPYYFYASTPPELVTELETRPPERVVVISRDLREYGIERYGDTPGHGQEILEWLSRNYARYAHAGGNPLDVRSRGVAFFKQNTP